MKLYKYLLVVLASFSSGMFAQPVVDENKGLVIIVTGGGEVSYEKTKKIATEPDFTDTVKVDFTLDYSSIDKKLNSKFELETVKPPKLLIIEPLNEIHKGQVKLGLNDFKTPPYFDFNYSTIRHKKYNAGIVMNHYSSDLDLKGKDDTRFTENNIGLYGKKINKKTTLSADLDYDYNTFRYYGYDPSLFILDPEDNQQYYSVLNGGVFLKSNKDKNTKHEYTAGVNYQQLFSKHQVQEHLIELQGEVNGYYLPSGGVMDSIDFTDVSGFWNLDVNAGYLISQDSVLNLSSTLVALRPTYKLKRKSISVTIGLPSYFLTNNSRFLTVLPTLNVEYAIAKDILIAYAGYDRKYERNHYLTYMKANPFIGGNMPHNNTYTRVDLVGGLKGAFTSKTTFNLGGHYRDMKGFVLYVNEFTSIGNRKFNVITDDVKHAQAFAEVIFENKKLNTGLLAEYNKYEMTSKFAYHLPEIVAQAFVKYNVQDKFYIGTELFYYGEQFALDNNDALLGTTSDDPITLKAIIDFNFSIDYKYNDKLGAFLSVNNILSTKHQRWNQYPNYGINVLGGVSYKF
ncbi:MAG: hypothetical protein ACJAZ2_001112 [Glaciecola sp.]|jgi:hypothetical protein